MASILDKIVEQTRHELIKKKKKMAAGDFPSMEEYHKPRRDFRNSLLKNNGVSIISEIKKASPLKGLFQENFNPLKMAETYQNNGASAISVLTNEPFFQGSLNDLKEVSNFSKIPVLRKDFMLDFYQIEEARAWGADAILIIVKITEGNQLYELHNAATECGLQVLVECYDSEDWDRLDFDRFEVVGVNNRNLDNFVVDLHRGVSLLSKAPENIVRVSESGIRQSGDIQYLYEKGIHSVLIGEHLMRARDPGMALAELSGFIN